MTTAIAGYDGTDAARAAVRFAARMGEVTGAHVVAATVHPDVPHLAGKGGADGAERLLEADAHREALDLLAGLDAPGVERLAVSAPSPAHGLHDLAVERDAGLLAVGATHRGAAGRLVPGSVGERLVHGAPCPVAVVPAEWAWTRRLERVAVAYDGGPESVRALDAACDLALRAGARLTLVAVYEPVLASYVAPGVSVASYDYDDELRAELAQDVAAVADGLPGALAARTRVLTGAPGHALVEAAADGVDLLVCGSRGYGPVRSVLAGSVSRHLVDHAPCPVLVVPRGVGAPASAAALAAVGSDV